MGYPLSVYEIRLNRMERLAFAVKKLNKLLQKKEMLKTADMPEKTFLFYSWGECEYPAELLTAFYREQYASGERLQKAEQLIVLDDGGETETTLVSQICGSFNYATVITRVPYKWTALLEAAYAEYGLSIRCVRDEKEVDFLDKPTLILDLSRNLAKCWKNYPADSVYMDLRESDEKLRWISVKCGGFLYISIRNALDTALKNGV